MALAFNIDRTRGGLADRTLGIRRHSLPGVLLTLLVVAFTVAGPTPTFGPRIGAAAMAVAVAAVFLVTALRASAHYNKPLAHDVWSDTALVVVAGILVWWAAGESAREYSGSLYRHVFIPVVWAFAGCRALCVLAARMFRWGVDLSPFSTALPHIELFQPTVPPEPVDGWRLVANSIVYAARQPGLFVLPTSIAVLLALPQQEWMLLWVVGGISAAALVLGSLSRRVRKAWAQWQVFFFRGTSLLISGLVVLLAALRLTEVTYVTTIFDGAAATTIVLFLLAAYTVSWWYDYWVTRLMAEAVIRTLGACDQGTSSISYWLAPHVPIVRAGRAHRILQVHGAGRLALIGPTTAPATSPAEEHQTIGTFDIFTKLAPGVVGGKGEALRAAFAARASLYAVVATALPFAALGGAAWVIHLGAQNPQVTVQGAGGVRSPSDLIFDDPHCESNRPVVILAASGGGTRAALYTEAVLEGLQRVGVAEDLRLLSGVSGGGAALAYFAAQRPALVGGNAAAWDDFFNRMGQPYIRDVLNGAVEWRFASRERLGTQLSASFSRRWALPASRRTFGQIDDVGLILNTAIAGEFDRGRVPESSALSALSLSDAERRHRKYSTTQRAGGRVLFTNLRLPATFPGQGLGPDGIVSLPLVVVADGRTALADGAALNANFPPVFANAGVDVDSRVRYWVTDGGATDNRGMEALLFATRQAIAEAPTCARPPAIHMVVVEASAYSDNYVQDRGLGTMMAAGSAFASQLAVELVGQIRSTYGQRGGRFEFHYLQMPRIFRQAFGTHWMLQPSVALTRADQTVTLDGERMARVVRALYGSPTGMDADSQRVWDWAQEDRGSTDSWQQLMAALRTR